jgi:hypothetical protein
MGCGSTLGARVDRSARKDVVVQHLITYGPVHRGVVIAEQGSCSSGKLAVLFVKSHPRMPFCHIHNVLFINVQFPPSVGEYRTHNRFVGGKSSDELGDGEGSGRGSQVSGAVYWASFAIIT